MDNSQLIELLNTMVSEDQNPDTLDIDCLPSVAIATKINHQDQLVAQAIEKILPAVGLAVDMIVNGFKQQGRLIYVGAGTSGRLGVLDAVECIPTFGIEEGMVIGLIAGGEQAMFRAVEGAEDNRTAGVDDLKAIKLNRQDVVVGIAASGRTPYVVAALEYANQIGAATIALSCNPVAEIGRLSQIALLPVVGPEPLTGSTRMKSGSAQKMVLNILTTASMIRLGKSYQNLMVDLKATNQKLVARGTRMIMQVTGVDQSLAETTLKQADNQVKLAILMLLKQIDRETASQRLIESDGFLRKALVG